jgi:hypothetical protein
VPIIVCSAALEDIRKHEAELRAMPRLTILRKPFSLDELEASVTHALGGGLPVAMDSLQGTVRELSTSPGAGG